MEKTKFSVSKKQANEGDYIDVMWECDLPDSVTLTIDNGYENSRMQLPDSGSRTIAIRKSKGKTTLRLNVACGNRIERKEIVVKVKNLKAVKAKPYRAPKSTSHNNSRLAPLRLIIKEWFNKLAYGMQNFGRRLSYSWNTLPQRKRRTYKWLLIILAAMWLGSLFHNSGYRAGYERGLNEGQTTLHNHAG